MNYLRTTVFLFGITAGVVCQQKDNGNAASGNAMDLALMTMNMMGHNSNCAIQPCQSVCQILNTTSGCYVCSTSCNAGSGSGLNAQLNPNVQMPIGGVSGCDSNWMQCPTSCTRSYTYGCVKCNCSAKSPRTTRETPLPTAKEILLNTIKSTSRQTQVFTTSQARTSTQTSKQIFTTTSVQSRRTNASLAMVEGSITPSTTSIKLSTLTGVPSPREVQTTLVSTLTSSKSIDLLVPNRLIHGADNESAFREEDFGTISTTSNAQETISSSPSMVKSVMIFVLSTCLVISLTLGSVLFIVWRRSARKLRRNKNELYFVQKSYRQDSKARLQNEAFNLDEPIYARIDTKPEVPPRSSPSTPTSPTFGVSHELLLRTESLGSQTSVKRSNDSHHDYLELI